jgi:hypothetical protein
MAHLEQERDFHYSGTSVINKEKLNLNNFI